MHDQLDDTEIIRLVRAGEADAFGVLVDRHGARITRLVRGFVRNEEDVRDIVQDAFVKAFSRLDRFDGRSQFYTWLYRIAANTSMDHNKKWKRRPTPLSLDTAGTGSDGEPTGVNPPNPGPPPEVGAMRSEMREHIDAALDELPEKYREVLVLREIEGLAYKDIATVLRVSRGTVESRLFRARERLRVRLSARRTSGE
ncbi:MAG: sigma-70 family RNA polymerase sigma factor [Planctomycetota bacterium]